MAQKDAPGKKPTPATVSPPVHLARVVVRLVVALVGLAAAGVVSLLIIIALALALAYPNLPDVGHLADYRPKLPLRVLTIDGKPMGEFGEERRSLVPIRDMPQVMIDAVLAIEDARFFEHGGVDYRGMVRAALANLGQAKSQGASTITMQVARNVYLSAEKSYTRKIYEVLLTFKLEHQLTKEQILEIYMNQIFLGHRAYGFAMAAQTYFGKPLADLSVAEAAMLAGLPKAPSAFNPLSNPRRARARQLHIIDRMRENGFITAAQAEEAKAEKLQLRRQNVERSRAEFAAEMVRQAIVAQYGEDAYTRGLVVTTTIRSDEQLSAYRAVRQGVMDFEVRQFYRGPELFIDLPADEAAREEAIEQVLSERPDNDDLLSAVVLEASATRVVAVRSDGEPITITGEGLRPVRSGLAERAAPNIRIRPGAVIRIMRTAGNSWRITQLPEVEAAFVALDPRTGDIRALVGGFDFQKNKFNRVTQAWRQPGSSFKPFIYSAALEKGVMPMTVVNDAPLFFSAQETGGKPWEPKNYDGTFEGPMSVRRALAKSKNSVSIRILQVVGTVSAQQWVSRFGFEPQRHPPYLTMALGAGSVTPMQMATGYGVFANGGPLVPPRPIAPGTAHQGKLLYEAPPVALDGANRVIDARNAFVTNNLLQEITRSGTAARAQSTLRRPDVYGKTGTTNDAVDAWFVGFHPTVVAATWVGYDTPRNLGSRETGGGLSLPIWISYMSHALRNQPVQEYEVPAGLVRAGGDWFYEEFGPGMGVQAIGMEEVMPGVGPAAAPTGGYGELPLTAPQPLPSDDRRRILDLFRN
ncbi:PBP1A family penicillin-binding protein [Hydrogenophaga sp.]|uniref:penicillin-binding protein 1A n=1 Tax=Hydrogenophaga sp. TaxID=1904254 RepID=UPI002BE2798D|nr:PBP1A family penicillin-binding protein [Hydrogenophaga sp.]HMP11092.1 PBP1A family penicillin-binding protein [Hydrogenophaga sp.]